MAAKALPEKLEELIRVDCALKATPDRIQDFFDCIDFDDSGTVAENEFIEGVLRLTLSKVPLEIHQLLKMLHRLCSEVIVLKQEQRHTETLLEHANFGLVNS